MKHLLAIILLAIAFEAAAQNFPDTTREFRGVWVATSKRIDYPTVATTDSKVLKQNYLDLLTTWRNAGYNAVIFQVRPAADAFFASEYEPWSEWLTGKQGRAPVPYFDPLEFMVRETHAIGMEYHAWFNPLEPLPLFNMPTFARSISLTLSPNGFLPTEPTNISTRVFLRCAII
ncbi:MAG: family 10 glycosylhydrolase [Bacteroidales bacterium]|nr:family 10 glycosylhydrolase [Bacteroidales bacterium]